MIIDKEGDITIVFQEHTSLLKFLENLKEAHARLKNDNLIVNLFSFSKLPPAQLHTFLEISNAHRAGKKSFVLVSDKVAYDDVPEELLVVPTLQEARDLIEMEEIERDLEL